MNHFNKQLEVNQPTLEQYLDEQSRKEQIRNRLDKFGLAILIFCGIIGVSYCMVNDHLFFKNVGKEEIGQSINGSNYSVAIAGLSKRQEESSAKDAPRAMDFVTVDGQFRAGESLTFTLDDYDDHAQYTFHFGNGETMAATSNQINYAYNLPGNYEVSLKVTYQGETQEAWSKQVTVSY